MKSSVLVIDNYDSFVFNLVRYLEELGVECSVVRNDELTTSDIMAISPAAIILSPGPCTPDEAGICVELVQVAAGEIPVLGVCLGHQVIGQAFGGAVSRAPTPLHGQASLITHDQSGVFADCPTPLRVARYHSLIVQAPLPSSLRPLAATADGVVMALEHTAFAGTETPIIGVQFHPESVLTEHGHRMLFNFLQMCGIACQLPEQLSEVAADIDKKLFTDTEADYWDR